MQGTKRRTAGVATTLFVLATGAAHAGAISDAGIFSQFNAVIFGNFTSTSDVEGRTVVGGSLTGGATFALNPAGAAASSYSALSVYGSVTGGGSYNVDHAGGVTIAGSNNGSFGIASGGAFVGGTNSGNLTVASGSVGIVGSNSGTLQLNSGGSVYIGAPGNTGQVSVSGSASVAINGNTSNNLTLNGGGTLSINGSNAGTISLSGGSVVYTGSLGSANLNGGATATQVPNLNLTAPTSTLGSFATTFLTPLTALSTQLNAVAPNSTVTSSNGAITFNARPNGSGSAVFDVGTSLFAANSTVTINLDGATSVIVNVNVDSCVQANCSFAFPNSVNFSDPVGYAATVLWNFVNATNLTFGNEFGGSVLAPDATVANSNPIDGTLVAAGFNGNGELHSHPYTGSFPGSGTLAPEPAGLAVFGTSLAGLVLIRRKAAGSVRRTGRRPGCGSCGSSAASAPG